MDELTPEIKQMLSRDEYGALLMGAMITEHGEPSVETVMVAYAPQRDIDLIRGDVKVLSRVQVAECPTAPLMRYLTYIKDSMNGIVALETFINIRAEDQFLDIDRLANQETLTIFFYNEEFERTLTKRVRTPGPGPMRRAIETMQEIAKNYPAEMYDFDLAKAQFMDEYPAVDIQPDVWRMLFHG